MKHSCWILVTILLVKSLSKNLNILLCRIQSTFFFRRLSWVSLFNLLYLPAFRSLKIKVKDIFLNDTKSLWSLKNANTESFLVFENDDTKSYVKCLKETMSPTKNRTHFCRLWLGKKRHIYYFLMFENQIFLDYGFNLVTIFEISNFIENCLWNSRFQKS